MAISSQELERLNATMTAILTVLIELTETLKHMEANQCQE